MRERLSFRLDELPIPLEIIGINGEQKTYILTAAGKTKVGASLQGLPDGRLFDMIQHNKASS